MVAPRAKWQVRRTDSSCGEPRGLRYVSFSTKRFDSMRKHTLTGNIKLHRAFRSRVLGNRRDILVYLPPGYRRFSLKRYPVLYLHDGQNVFDAATSFAGVEWGVDETAQRLIASKIIEPLIIVAVANIGEDRVHEYTPTPAVIEAKIRRKKHSRGLARIYGQFSDRRIEAFHRQKISNQAGGRIYRTRWIIAGWSWHAGNWNFLSRGIHAFNCDVPIRFGGMTSRFSGWWNLG